MTELNTLPAYRFAHIEAFYRARVAIRDANASIGGRAPRWSSDHEAATRYREQSSLVVALGEIEADMQALIDISRSPDRPAG